MIDNEDIFTQLYEDIRNGMSINDVRKNYGGGSIYIQILKSTTRNEEIKERYSAQIKVGKKRNKVIKALAREYNLSETTIYGIINSETSIQPSLFD
ncbi:MAG: hypothetical protein LBG67_04565 [Campylobacteraceae bacterium]|jgi:Mor family transcriptional regulator|nr:hypothetical protein [Campylobacteraceae bacterium]